MKVKDIGMSKSKIIIKWICYKNYLFSFKFNIQDFCTSLVEGS